MRCYLESSRVVLREFVSEDLDKLVELDGDPEVMKYLSEGEPTSRDDMVLIMNRTKTVLEKYNHKLGIWAAIEKSTSKFMGWFHLRPSKKDSENLKLLELRYRLKREFWSKGIATEVSKKLLTKAFDELGASEVFAITIQGNLASRRVMEKIGLKFSHDFVDDSFKPSLQNQVWYSLKKPDL